MELKDFRIGRRFYTGSGAWVCVDVGKRSILAVKENEAVIKLKGIGITDPRAEHMIDNSDYLLDTTIFFEMEFGGCRKKDTFDK